MSTRHLTTGQNISNDGDNYGDINFTAPFVAATGGIDGVGLFTGALTLLGRMVENPFNYGDPNEPLMIQEKYLPVAGVSVVNTATKKYKSIKSSDGSVTVTDDGNTIDLTSTGADLSGVVKYSGNTDDLDMGEYSVTASSAYMSKWAASPTFAQFAHENFKTGSVNSGFLHSSAGQARIRGVAINIDGPTVCDSTIKANTTEVVLTENIVDDIDMNDFKITELDDGVDPGDAVNKGQLDLMLPKTGGTVTGKLTVNNEVSRQGFFSCSANSQTLSSFGNVLFGNTPTRKDADFFVHSTTVDSDEIKVLKSGDYKITIDVTVSFTVTEYGTGDILAELIKSSNGGSTWGTMSFRANNTNNGDGFTISASRSGIVPLVANDLLAVQLSITDTGVTSRDIGADYTNITIEKIS